MQAKSLFIFLSILLLASLPLSAQTLGGITGQVADSTGAVIPGATVTITNTDTSAVRTLTTNEAGLFTAPGLTPGPYEVRVETEGFGAQARALTLQVQQTARLDFALEVGQVAESIEVTSEAALLDTTNATVGTVIDNQRIVDLPLNGRNFLQLVALSPNVTAGFGSQGNTSRQGGQRMQQNMSISGMRATWNRYTLDGVENTDPNFNTYVVLPSVDFLQEFKVQSGIFPAEFGRASSQINVSTKSGTNQFHGTAFWFLRNDKTSARNYAFEEWQHDPDANPKSNLKWNQYGFTLGGPVIIPKVFNGKDKMFFSVNWEGFRQRSSGTSTYSVPDAAMRAGDFSGISNTIYDPLGRSQNPDGSINVNPFPGNRIDPSRTSHQTDVLWEFYPAPNQASQSPDRPDRNYAKTRSNSVDKDQFHLRLDFNESSNSNWYFRYSWTDETTLGEGLHLNGSKLITTGKQYMLANTRVLSPTVVNEFRFGINQFHNATARELAGVRNVVEELQIPGLVTGDPIAWGIPRMRIQDVSMSGFGDDSQGPFDVRNTLFQINDNISIIKGKHSIRFGFELRRDRYNQLGNEFPRGSFDFDGTSTQDPNNSSGTGHSIADFYLGHNTRAEIALANAFHQFRGTGQYYYIDDTIRLTPKLTISAGLRYENTPPYWDRSGKLVNAYIPQLLQGVPNVQDMSLHPVLIRTTDVHPTDGSGSEFYSGLPIEFASPIQVARDDRITNRLIHSDNNDFAPRLGIAYSPTDKWSIRAGAGVFYNAETGNSRFDMARNVAGRTQADTDDFFPELTMENSLGSAPGKKIVSTPYTLAIKPDIRTSVSYQWIFSVQRELDLSTVLDVNYSGSVSKHTQGLVDQNQAAPGITPLSDRKPFREFGVIQSVSGSGAGNYNGLGVKLTRRMTDGLTAMVSYTWSKSIDTMSAIRGQGGFQAPQDSGCESCERAPSDFNTPHRFVTSVLYELPFGRGRRYGSSWNAFLNGALGGWQVGSIITIESGRPTNGNKAWSSWSGVGYRAGVRIDATGQDWSINNRTTERWFNTGAFQLQPRGMSGNGGRNNMLGPGNQHWDASAHKNFRIYESHELQFRFEMFNAGNIVNWSNPGSNWGNNNVNAPSSSFGRIRGTDSMRKIQFALKYIF